MCVERKGVFMAECKNMREKRKKRAIKLLKDQLSYHVIDL